MARAKVAEMRAREARRARRQRLFTWVGAAVLAMAAAVAIAVAVATGGKGHGAASHTSAPHLKLGPISALGSLQPAPSPGKAGFEGVPIPPSAPLAGRSAAATGGVVDGIRCQRSEQLVFHIHSHLTIFINGTQRQVPAGIGIPASPLAPSKHRPPAPAPPHPYSLPPHPPH